MVNMGCDICSAERRRHCKIEGILMLLILILLIIYVRIKTLNI